MDIQPASGAWGNSAGVTEPARSGKPASKRIVPPNPLRAGIVMLGFLAVLYLVELVDAMVFSGSLDHYGISARDASGLLGVIWAPLLHASWHHLLGNTILVAVFGYLAMATGLGPWIATTVTIWLVSGLGVWLTGPSVGVTIGASGIAFGWLAFLLVRGLFNRSPSQLLIALVLLFFWGGVLFGLLPGNPHISWQAHLFGALGGILAAWFVARVNRRSAGQAMPTRSPNGSLAA